MKLLIPSIVFVALISASCATTQSFVNDDVYSVRPSELPIGESTADEVSYASFKSRKQGNTNDRMTYADEVALQNRQNCLNQWRWYDGCGCSYSEWLNYSRHSPRNNMSYSMYWGSPSSMFFYGSPYPYMGGYHYAVGPWGYNYYMYPYNRPYGWYGSGMGFGVGGYYSYDYYGGYGHGIFFNYGYGFGGYPYGYYGYGYSGYGYGGNMNGWMNNGNSAHKPSNVYRGPRGTTSSGYHNPTGRAATPVNKVQMGRVDTPGAKGGRVPAATATAGRTPATQNPETTTPGRKIVSREIPNREVVSKTSGYSRATAPIDKGSVPNVTPSRTTGNTQPTGVQRRAVPSATTAPQSPQPGRVNKSVDFQGNYPSRTTTPNTNTRGNNGATRMNSGISRPSGGFERSSLPSGSGSISTPSRGSSSGMGSSSSGSSRSGGSTGAGVNSGRR